MSTTWYRSTITGKDYRLFNYYGDPEATDIIVAMGSVTGAIEQTVDTLCAQGKKVGFIQVHLYRPFSERHLLKVLPDTCERIAVLDRCKCMGDLGEPLYQDVCTVMRRAGKDHIKIIGGRYGLSSKDTDPAQIAAVYENLEAEKSIDGFTIGINDDVTHKSLETKPFQIVGDDFVSCKFWGLGGDGTVGANKSTVDIINSTTDMYGQAYFEYDAKKTLGTTKSHLRFSKTPIRSSYYVKWADFVACHNHHYINEFNVVDEIKPGGMLLLECPWEPEEVGENLSPKVKRNPGGEKHRVLCHQRDEDRGGDRSGKPQEFDPAGCILHHQRSHSEGAGHHGNGERRPEEIQSQRQQSRQDEHPRY